MINMRMKISIGLAVLLVAGFVVRQATVRANVACTISDFTATVRQGSSTEQTLFAGSVALQEDSDGGLTGTFTSNDRKTTAQVIGQANGHAINLAFDLGSQQYLFAVGTMWNTFADCSGVMGGPFVGPNIGDLGDWSVK